ncbi:UNVERIFIED_CONTAM: hypothetical protein PYX00_003477 [Menopon gallinae]|uniref:1-alkyl-2-acetylglycerophosphocholine esterase n=1 Tax=Menopon gallinae TaxID=328185 RepID=A0AAW2I0K3_9NEOP
MARKKVPKHLPYSTGPYVPGCVDVMVGYTKEGLFTRIYYPTSETDLEENSSRWISWLPHQMYIIGFAYILRLWNFLIKLLMKYVAGDIKIPVIEKGDVNRNIGKLKAVVFSHGLGGTRFLYTNICCELASYGFVVIALEHRDGSASMTYYYDSEQKKLKNDPTWFKVQRVHVGGPEHFPKRKSQVEKRSSECKRALDILENLNNGVDIGNILDDDFDFKQFKDNIDFSKTIMMGHSFGGATALLTLGTDYRFKVGVILDPWMFSIKSHKDLPNSIEQPLIFINTQTFHIVANLKELEKYTSQPNREMYTIRQTTHENQSDTVHVIGYWLNIFMKKINKELGSRINNSLILRFLEKHVEIRERTSADEYLKSYKSYIVEDIAIEGVYNKPKPIPRIW